MLKAYKYRLYPTSAQAELIKKNIDCCRLVYNLALEAKKYAYSTQGIVLSRFDLMKQLTDLKEDYVWLNDVDSQALQQSITDLDKAFVGFFKGFALFPKFKNKNATQSFRNPHGSKVVLKGGKIFQPKFIRQGIKIVIDREFSGEIRSTTISKTSTGKYFVSVLVENNVPIQRLKEVKEETSVGVDLGLKSFLVTSDGLKIDNPKHLQKQLSHFKYLSRQYSNKKKGSANRGKSQLKLALQHEKITNQRKDFLHKLSSELVHNHDTLCFETLQIESMVKNHKLAQAIQSSGWAMFVEMCKYKASWSGKNILQIPTFQPSTKICSNCEYKNNILTLADREWLCANCGVLHDRDINAAINIKKYSLKNCARLLRKKPVELPTLVGALKQEAIINKKRSTEFLIEKRNRVSNCSLVLVTTP